MPGIIVGCSYTDTPEGCAHVRRAKEWQTSSKAIVTSAKNLIGERMFFYNFENDLILGCAKIIDVSTEKGIVKLDEPQFYRNPLAFSIVKKMLDGYEALSPEVDLEEHIRQQGLSLTDKDVQLLTTFGAPKTLKA